MNQPWGKIADIARALADPARFKIIELLGRGDYCVNALANLLNMTQPAVSQHLKVLKQAGLVTPEKKGYWVHYSINSQAIESYLVQVQKLLPTKGRERICPKKARNAQKAKTLKKCGLRQIKECHGVAKHSSCK